MAIPFESSFLCLVVQNVQGMRIHSSFEKNQSGGMGFLVLHHLHWIACTVYKIMCSVFIQKLNVN